MPLRGTCKKCGGETSDYCCYNCDTQKLERQNEMLRTIVSAKDKDVRATWVRSQDGSRYCNLNYARSVEAQRFDDEYPYKIFLYPVAEKGAYMLAEYKTEQEAIMALEIAMTEGHLLAKDSHSDKVTVDTPSHS